MKDPMKMCLLFLFGLCLILSFAQPIRAQSQVPVLISLPDTTAAPGDTILVPVRIGDVTGLGIVSSDLLITYDARIVKAGRVILTDTFTDRWTEAHRVGFVTGSADTIGLIDIAVATSNRIPTGAGVLLKIEFIVLPTAVQGQKTTLTLSEAILNSRNPQTTTKNGSITVRTQPVLVGDFNGDCVVNFQDFLLFAQNFGRSQGDSGFDPAIDLNGDGSVNFPDFLIFILNFGKRCT
jgi:hypothetical protein